MADTVLSLLKSVSGSCRRLIAMKKQPVFCAHAFVIGDPVTVNWPTVFFDAVVESNLSPKPNHVYVREPGRTSVYLVHVMDLTLG